MEEQLKYVDLVYRTLMEWYESFAKFTPNLIVGLVVFCFFYFTSRFFTRMAVRLLNKIFPAKTDLISSLTSIVRFAILLIGSFISLEIMGLSGFLWKFIGSLGVAGVIAGVALKDLVSSIFSGMLVSADKAFVIGDYVTIGSNSGTVADIGFLTTKIINDEGKKVYIPNQLIFNSPFINVTASEQRKIIFNFDIPADEDIETARKVVLDGIKELPNIDKSDTAEVNFTALNQGAFTMQVKFWVAVGANVIHTKSEALLKIKHCLTTAGIQLVTPQSISVVKPEDTTL